MSEVDSSPRNLLVSEARSLHHQKPRGRWTVHSHKWVPFWFPQWIPRHLQWSWVETGNFLTLSAPPMVTTPIPNPFLSRCLKNYASRTRVWPIRVSRPPELHALASGFSLASGIIIIGQSHQQNIIGCQKHNPLYRSLMPRRKNNHRTPARRTWSSRRCHTSTTVPRQLAIRRAATIRRQANRMSQAVLAS